MRWPLMLLIPNSCLCWGRDTCSDNIVQPVMVTKFRLLRIMRVLGRSLRSGGAHVTMPVWGDILTAEQLDALVKYTFAALAKAKELLLANVFLLRIAAPVTANLDRADLILHDLAILLRRSVQPSF